MKQNGWCKSDTTAKKRKRGKADIENKLSTLFEREDNVRTEAGESMGSKLVMTLEQTCATILLQLHEGLPVVSWPLSRLLLVLEAQVWSCPNCF